ncbi:2'-5' RNA ligase family protein [Jiella pelagia]
MADAPLILTLGFDAASFAHLDAMRRRHFPAERNLIPAHLTLFHHLPGDEEQEIAATLRAVTRDAAPIPLTVTGLRFLGRGTAYEIAAPRLTEAPPRPCRPMAVRPDAAGRAGFSRACDDPEQGSFGRGAGDLRDSAGGIFAFRGDRDGSPPLALSRRPVGGGGGVSLWRSLNARAEAD